ncbi:MAG TPA: hypothetical protein VMI32_13015 [Candidatus Solibacter sp.]|nr:hypothetical protein [Candidatus Solibacter sp.]
MYLESDLYQAAYLIARGIPLNELRPIGSRIIFAFEDSDGQASAAVKEYSQGASLPAREFAQAIALTKTRLYGAKFSKGTRTEPHYDYSRHSYR